MVQQPRGERGFREGLRSGLPVTLWKLQGVAGMGQGWLGGLQVAVGLNRCAEVSVPAACPTAQPY